jgi:ribonuclease Z
VPTRTPDGLATSPVDGPRDREEFMRTGTILLVVMMTAATFMLSGASAGRKPDVIQVTLLGTGTPIPNPTRFGPSILVEAGNETLLFDCGRGAVTRLTEAGVALPSVDVVFLTHLHSDHLVGFPDIWLTGWLLGRKGPLRVVGPEGTRGLIENLRRAFRADRAFRQTPPERLPPEGVEIEANEVREGVVYESGGVRVSACLVDHRNVQPAFAYRVDYRARSAVVSGDTLFSQSLVDFSRRADLLIHAAWLPTSRNPTPAGERSIASAEDAGRVFALVKPRLAVVYHYLDDEGLADAVRTEYDGNFVVGKDLMKIEVGKETVWREGEH